MTGAATCHGGLTVASGMTIAGGTHCDGLTSNGYLNTGPLHVGGALNVSGAGSTTFSGPSVFNNTVNITGATTLQNLAFVQQPMTCQGLGTIVGRTATPAATTGLQFTPGAVTGTGLINANDVSCPGLSASIQYDVLAPTSAGQRIQFNAQGATHNVTILDNRSIVRGVLQVSSGHLGSVELTSFSVGGSHVWVPTGGVPVASA